MWWRCRNLENRSDAFDEIFIDFYDKNCRYLVKYLFFLVNDITIAEDLSQDIFLRLYKSKNVNIANPKFKSYLKKAARNIAVDHLKKLTRDEAKQEKIIPVLKVVDETVYSNLEDIIIDGEVISTVRDVLEEFSEKNRKIFISRVFEQKTRRQISKEEEISFYAIKRVEDEILKILKERLKQYL